MIPALDKFTKPDIILFREHKACLESWLSGLRRTTGNRVWGDTSPRVQIPNSPPLPADLLSAGFVQ